jgi:hypothetical protein
VSGDPGRLLRAAAQHIRPGGQVVAPGPLGEVDGGRRRGLTLGLVVGLVPLQGQGGTDRAGALGGHPRAPGVGLGPAGVHTSFGQLVIVAVDHSHPPRALIAVVEA